MKERPILFSAPMVRAILEGRKTQTRRTVRHCRQFSNWDAKPGDAYGAIVSKGGDRAAFLVAGDHGYTDTVPCPYGAPGDRLWVRETWGLHAHGDETDWLRESVRGIPPGPLGAQYNLALRADWGPLQEGCFWRPGIFMPRWASRITLEITQVRVHRLHEISEEDAIAEGVCIPDAATAKQDAVDAYGMTPYRGAFACLWESINGKRAPWSSNPWVWAYTFRRVP